MSVIDVGALPGNILYSTMSTCSRLPSISARAPGYLFERGSRKKGSSAYSVVPLSPLSVFDLYISSLIGAIAGLTAICSN